MYNSRMTIFEMAGDVSLSKISNLAQTARNILLPSFPVLFFHFHYWLSHIALERLSYVSYLELANLTTLTNSLNSGLKFQSISCYLQDARWGEIKRITDLISKWHTDAAKTISFNYNHHARSNQTINQSVILTVSKMID